MKGENQENSLLKFNHYLAELATALDGFIRAVLTSQIGMASSTKLNYRRQKLQIVDERSFVTNTKILAEEASRRAWLTLSLIKFSQIGSLTETLAAIKMAKDAGYTAVISHRSGETEDAAILWPSPVGTAAGQIKTGSYEPFWPVLPYNQLIRIEEALGSGSFQRS